MSGGCKKGRRLDLCGWEDLGPHRPENRAALDQIAYRVGRHSEFLARMLHQIPREMILDAESGNATAPLRNLGSRTTDDPTVALMDAWASTLDVLAFYQERIANEGYIRTTRERVSAVELARTIGYELNPGVAASSRLAFTVESADDPYRVLEVPVGVQVMSVPKETDEQPQIFETVESVTARAEWNEIPARTEREQNLAVYFNPDNKGDGPEPENGTLFLLDIDGSFDLSGYEEEDGDDEALTEVDITRDNNLAFFLPVTSDLNLDSALDDLEDEREPDDDEDVAIAAIAVEQVQLRGVGLGLKEGQRLLVVGSKGERKEQEVEAGEAVANDDGNGNGDDEFVVKAFPFRILSVEEDTNHDLTRVEIASVFESEERELVRPGKLKLRFKTPVFPVAKMITTPVTFNQTEVSSQFKRRSWAGATLQAFFKTQKWPRVKLMRLFRRAPDVKAPAVGEVEPGIHILRQSLGFFGCTASKWELLAKAEDTRGGGNSDPYKRTWEGRTIWEEAGGGIHTGADVYLERGVDEVVPGGLVLFETSKGHALSFLVGAAVVRSRADFGLSGKATGLILRTLEDGKYTLLTEVVDEDPDDDKGAETVPKTTETEAKFKFRISTAHVASETLPLAGLPIEEDLEAGSSEVMLDNLYLDLEPGQAISLGGERADAPGIQEAETLIVADVTHTGGFTRLKLQSGNEFSYKRTSIRVNANVALATHGETIDEALGDGDATLPNQAFALAKPPLTFVSASNETGSETTLTIRVNDVAWTEAESLYDAGPDDEVYAVRIDEDGTTRAIFGDGVHGRRLPTAPLVVTAVYRCGMGTEGEVDEETLVLLKKRPLGVRAVTNPSPATGAAAAETLEDARIKAPQSVRTLGRIVSLIDHEDYARAFAGIGKARAAVVWQGTERLVQVTVTPTTDTVFTGDAATLLNLADSMNRYRDPICPLEVTPHEPALFQLAARVVYDTRHLPEVVEADVKARMESDFGFAARELVQPVSAAEVISSMHEVAGVDHVILTALDVYREEIDDEEPELGTVLFAEPARLKIDETEAEDGAGAEEEETGEGTARTVGAELLTLLPSAITLTMEPADE